MTGLFVFVHALVSILLIVIVLMQSGRGGGLTEGFGGAAESVFGAKTNEFMIRATAIAGTIFLVTSLSLAHLSSRTERSLMAVQKADSLPVGAETTNIPELPRGVTSPEDKAIADVETPIQVQKTQEVVNP